MVNYLLRRSRLYDISVMHDDDPVAEVLNQGDIMRNEEIRHLHFLLQFIEEGQDVGLYGYIQGRRGLIENQQLRLNGQGPGDGRSLTLTAADLMRIPVGKGCLEAAALQEALTFCCGVFFDRP